MLRLPNPRVRRRLFEADEQSDQAKIDNFANILQESIKRDIIEKSQKWNFDFEKELPLEGPYQWLPCTEEAKTVDWVGKKEIEKEKFIEMKSENEATPKTRADAVPVLRKRRRNIDVVPDKAVRRRISFD